MITYLKVRNLAIVEEFAIEPGPGLNVLTGETGAGKSLLIDSLEFLSGARGSSESIRGGTEKMTAEAVVQAGPGVRARLEELGADLDAAGGSEIIVRREIATTGRGRVLINGSVFGVRELLSAMESVVEIHGQNESHDRIAGKGFREVLDEFAGNDDLLSATAAAWREWKEAASQLEQLAAAQQELSLRLDLLRYQIDEIGAARLKTGEEESLRGERSVLAHARETIEATAGAYALIEEDESAALTQIARAQHLLQPLSGKIDDIRRLWDDLEDLRIRLQEQGRALSHLADSVRLDPARLEEVEDRLAVIDRLRKKYGGSVEAALEHLQKITAEHERLVNYESNLEKLRTAEEKTFAAYRDAAEALSASRRKAAPRLEGAVREELDDLAMERTTVRVTSGHSADAKSRLRIGERGVAFGPAGFDQIEILIAPNQGEEPKPMQRIASGGELSRIQLAIAAALFRESERSADATLVFDEIDAGIGGRVAEAVGRKLRQLATANQVICVTHLPQIASLAATHFRVWKEEAGGRTRARIERIDEREQRIAEIARMLGGEVITESARVHARELLSSGEAAPRKRASRAAVSRLR